MTGKEAPVPEGLLEALSLLHEKDIRLAETVLALTGAVAELSDTVRLLSARIRELERE